MESLGNLRATYPARRRGELVAMALAAPLLLVTLSGAAQETAMSPAMRAVTGQGTTAQTAEFAAGLVAIFALGAYLLTSHRKRRNVLLYDEGVAIETKRTREVVRFADVDELWCEVAAGRTAGRGHDDDKATLRAVRLKTHDGRSHAVPLDVAKSGDLLQALVRRCSFPLHAEALRALEQGESMAFGAVHLDITKIGSDAPDEWSINWSELSKVRIRRSRIELFRRQSQQLVAWRTIGIAEVPHPTIFAACVVRSAEAVAPDVEIAIREGSAWVA